MLVRRKCALALVVLLVAALSVTVVLHVPTTSVEYKVDSLLAEMRAEERDLTSRIIARLRGRGTVNRSAPDWLWLHALGHLTPNSERIIGELAALGPPAVPRLLGALNSTCPPDRCAALFALARIRDPRAADAVVPILLAKLDEKRPVWRLTRLGTPLPVSGIRDLAVPGQTDRPASRLPEIVEGLLVRQPWGYEDLIERLYVNSHHDVVTGAYEDLIDRLYVDSHHVVVTGFRRLPRRADTVRQGALALERDTLERVALVRILGDIGDRRAVPALVEQLGHWDPSLREEVAGALGRIGADLAVEPLGKILKDQAEEDPVRIAAAGALAKIGGPAALAALKQHLDDRDPAVAEIARRALKAATHRAKPADR